MRKEKKSETLEIRLSLSEKTALASRAAERGESMSAAMRRMIAADAVPCSEPKETSMSKRALFLIAPLALATTVIIAISFPDAQARTDFAGNFRAMDANGDGFVDRKELIDIMKTQSAKVDLPPVCAGTELARKWSLPPHVLADGEIEFADADGDGRLTLTEVVAANERNRADEFLQADMDSNGFVTLTEMKNAFKADEININAGCRKAIGLYGAATAPGVLARLDRNGDKRVSIREFVDH